MQHKDLLQHWMTNQGGKTLTCRMLDQTIGKLILGPNHRNQFGFHVNGDDIRWRHAQAIELVTGHSWRFVEIKPIGPPPPDEELDLTAKIYS